MKIGDSTLALIEYSDEIKNKKIIVFYMFVSSMGNIKLGSEKRIVNGNGEEGLFACF